MSTFLAGAVFGALFMGAAAVLFVTRHREREHDHEIVEWSDEEYEAPPIATTRILIKERNIQL